MSLSNATTRQSFSRSETMSDPDVSSAEWIAEAPSACDSAGADGTCAPLPLTDFGTVNFPGYGGGGDGGYVG